MMKDKYFRRSLAAALAVLVIALLWFFLPVSGGLARHAAESKGYKVPSDYSDTRYRTYYQGLSNSGKEAYRILVAELPDFPERVAIPLLRSSELQDVYSAVSYDNPEFFFLAYDYSYSRSGALNYFEPHYIMSRAEYQNKLAAVRRAASNFLRGAPVNGSDYDKELYVHDNLVLKNTYAEGDQDMIYTIYGALVNNYCNCEGYSRSAVYLLKKLGVRSCVIPGTAIRRNGSRSNHMWNKVWLNGSPYMMEITFDDYRLVNGSGGSATDGVSHIYLNLSWNDISRNHILDDSAQGKDCTREDMMYFRKNGMYFSTYEEAKRVVPGKTKQALQDGKTSIEMRFSSSLAYSQARSGFLQGDDFYEILDGANAAVEPSKRVSNKRIQYVTDDQYYVIRIYFQ